MQQAISQGTLLFKIKSLFSIFKLDKCKIIFILLSNNVFVITYNFITIKSDTNHFALYTAIQSWMQCCLVVAAKLLCEIKLQTEGLVKRLYTCTKIYLKGQVGYGH